jgi:ABC-type dipeptide/oligopeptide/nickel transport system ATPase component
MNRLRGEQISMIFQNPRASLNPLYRVEKTLDQVLSTHRGLRGAPARRASLDLLVDVGLPDPERVLRRYPHELSGGMCQRVMIALALASEPSLLIADEPTTALDVTVQLQIIRLLSRLRKEHGLTLILITHNLSVVAELCDRGRRVPGPIRGGPVVDLDRPRHLHTVGLLASRPSAHMDGAPRSSPARCPTPRASRRLPAHPRCSWRAGWTFGARPPASRRPSPLSSSATSGAGAMTALLEAKGS